MSQQQLAIREELLCLGFEENLIDQALAITSNKEHAINLIFEFQEDQQTLQATKFQPTKEIATGSTKMQIDVRKMSYPMGDDVKTEYHKMVLLVRMDLKMGSGKIAAQTGHAVLGAYQSLKEKENYKATLEAWEESGSAKIVLRVNSKEEMIALEKSAVDAGINTYVVCDAGRTQVEPGSLTVCALGPARGEKIDAITRHLKLLE